MGNFAENLNLDNRVRPPLIRVELEVRLVQFCYASFLTHTMSVVMGERTMQSWIKTTSVQK